MHTDADSHGPKDTNAASRGSMSPHRDKKINRKKRVEARALRSALGVWTPLTKTSPKSCEMAPPLLTSSGSVTSGLGVDVGGRGHICARASLCSVITLLNGMFIAFHSVHSKSSPESSCPPSGQTICAAFDLRSMQEKLGKNEKTIPLVGSGWEMVARGVEGGHV